MNRSYAGAGTTIQRVETQPLEVELVEPFGISRGAQATVKNVLVRVTLASGIVGYGEAAPLPVFNNETQAGAMQAIRQAHDAVLGTDIADWETTAAAVRPLMVVDRVPVLSAQCAIEMALLDARARVEGKPLWKMFGALKAQELRTDYTITQHPGMSVTDAVAHAEEATRRALALGVRTLKIKVGGTEVARDVARIVEAERTAPGSTILLDGNASMSAEDAIELLHMVEQAGVVVSLFEQPLAPDDWPGMKKLRAETNVKLAADEAASGLAAAQEAIASKCFNAINIKIMKTAILESLQIIGRCKEEGLELMIGGMVETNLAVSVSAAMAAGLGGFTFIDLDLPYFLKSTPFRGGARWEGDLVVLDDEAPGIGIELAQAN